MPTIYALSLTCRFINVRLYGVTQLGLRFYPVGSSAPKTVTMTFQLYGSDQLVSSTAQLQPVSPSAKNLPLRQWQDHSFLTTGIPIQPFQVDITIFMDPSIHMGDPYGGFREHGPIQASHQLFRAQGGFFGSASLGSSAPGPQGYNCFGQNYGTVLYQQAGGTRSHSLLRLEVDLFLFQAVSSADHLSMQA